MIVKIENDIIDIFKISIDFYKIATIMSMNNNSIILNVESNNIEDFKKILTQYYSKNNSSDTKIKNKLEEISTTTNEFIINEDCFCDDPDLDSNSCEDVNSNNENDSDLDIDTDSESNSDNEDLSKENLGGYIENDNEKNNNLIENDNESKMLIAKIFKDTLSNSKRIEELNVKKNKLIVELIQVEQSIYEQFIPINNNKIINKFFNDINNLKNALIVEKIYFTNNELIIITKELITKEKINDYFILHLNQHKIIGRMRLGINLNLFFGELNQSYNFVTIHNMDRSYYNEDCTKVVECGHVFRTGEMCFGDVILTSLIKAFALKDIPLIFDLLIRFITQPDQNDEMGKYIRKFPNVDEK
jgi:hypothetical protein